MKKFSRIIVLMLTFAMLLCFAGCKQNHTASSDDASFGSSTKTDSPAATEPEPADESSFVDHQSTQSEGASNDTVKPSVTSEPPEVPNIRDDALAAAPLDFPKPFELGYFTALNNPVVLAESMGVTFSADEKAEFTTPYDCNIDRAILVENTGELSVFITWKVTCKAQGLSEDDIMTHPQPQMYILDPGKSTVIRPCWQYSPVDIALSDATFNVEVVVINRNTMQRETVRFDLHNHISVTHHSKPLPGNATISGKIVSAATGKPLKNLPIEITDANFRYILWTDNNGEYEASVYAYKNAREYYIEYAIIVNAEASNAQIHMRKGNNDEFSDYGQARRVVAPKPGEALTIDIALQPKAEQLNYSLSSIMDIGIQAYAFDATGDGSVIATVPFHTGLPDKEREKTAYLHVFDYTGKLFFKKHIVDETPAIDVSKDGSLIATTIKEQVSDEHTRAVVYDRQGKVFYMTDVMEYDSPLVGKMKSEIWAVQVSDDNRLLAYGDTAGMVWLVDMETDKIIWSEYCGGQVRKLGFDKGDSVLYVSAGDGYLRCFSTKNGSLLWETYVDAWITKWTITEHYITAMTKASPCTVQVVDKNTGENVLSIPVTTGGSEAAMSPDESLIWYGNSFSGGKSSLSNNIYDINGKMLYSMIQPGMAAAFTADSKLFAVQNTKTIAVVNREGQILWQYDFVPDISHPNSWANATVLWISDDGKYIISGANGDLSANNLGQIFFFSRD
jgi:outer membrane protein assembly factor BamB